jgi:TonB family protein
VHSFAEQNRAFGYAVAASLALHALALFVGWPALQRSPAPLAPAPALLITRLAEPQIVPEAPQEEPRPAQPKREAPKAAPKPVAKPAAPRPAEEAPAEPEPASAEPPPTAPAVALQSPTILRAEADRALEATTAAQYRLQLIGAAQRYKPQYPAIARDNNWIGNVVLDVVIRPDGRAELSMRRGSGHEVLDHLAFDTFQQAIGTVPVPSALRGKQVILEPLIVVYSLKD